MADPEVKDVRLGQLPLNVIERVTPLAEETSKPG